MKNKSDSVSRSIIFIPLSLIALFTIVGFGLIDHHFVKTASNRYQRDLVRLAHSGARVLPLIGEPATISDYDAFADLFAGDSRFRVTIIYGNGVVLGDSRLSLGEIKIIENHKDRPEIVAARNTGVGVSRRYSSTLGIDLLYAAVRYHGLDGQSYFRVALPLTELNHELNGQRLVLGGFCLVALIIAVGLSLLASRYLLSVVQRGKMELEIRVRKRTREIEILQNFGTQLTACNSMDEALEVIGLVTAMLLPRLSGSLALIRASRDKLEIVKTWNGRWTGKSKYSPDECWSLRTGNPHIGNPMNGKVSCGHATNQENQTLCIPLVAQGEPLGVIHFTGSQDMEWTSAEQKLAAAVAEHTSLTLANLQLRESLRQQAIRDTLTGLYNRRYLLETMESEISRSERHNQQLGVLMIDLDHFKQFNDEYGHDIGDFILSEFGRLTKTIIRNEDIACRFGGEEFTLLLPDTDRDGTLHVAHKLLNKIREHNFILGNHAYGPITASIGAAVFPDNGRTCAHLIKRADDALYHAKHGGRNQVAMDDGTA